MQTRTNANLFLLHARQLQDNQILSLSSQLVTSNYVPNDIEPCFAAIQRNMEQQLTIELTEQRRHKHCRQRWRNNP